jgi:hypothetical protein
MIQAEQLSEVIAKILAGDHDSFGTFALLEDDERWVQYKPGEINAAYPFADDPAERLGFLPDFEVLGWEANGYVFGDLNLYEAVAIVEWIDRYFTEVLGCVSSYQVTIKLEL